MTDALSVCNLGLGKIAASRISSLSPPRSSLERHCASGYPTWRDQEIAKRRWVFALAKTQLVQVAEPLTSGRNIYQYGLPPKILRPLRDKHTRWEIRGVVLFSDCPDGQWLEYLQRVDETLFDPLFTDVLASRVAVESVEFASQSNTKGQTADSHYAASVNEAARANAFIIGPEDIQTPDEEDTWISGRWGPC